jgi:hypothetical protein
VLARLVPFAEPHLGKAHQEVCVHRGWRAADEVVERRLGCCEILCGERVGGCLVERGKVALRRLVDTGGVVDAVIVRPRTESRLGVGRERERETADCK